MMRLFALAAFVLLAITASFAYIRLAEGKQGDFVSTGGTPGPSDDPGRILTGGAGGREDGNRGRMMNGSLNGTRKPLRIMRDYREDYREADCNRLNTTRERFLCGMHSMRKDSKLVPEACREKDGADRESCERLHENLERCRNESVNQSRCALRVLGMDERKEVRDEVRDCRQNSTNASQCIHELRDKVDDVINFRLDNLISRAKMFAEKDIVTEDEAADFVAKVEALKSEYKTLDLQGKKQKILEIKDLWGKFVSSARSKKNGSG